MQRIYLRALGVEERPNERSIVTNVYAAMEGRRLLDIEAKEMEEALGNLSVESVGQDGRLRRPSLRLTACDAQT
jgi:hypothetical protein